MKWLFIFCIRNEAHSLRSCNPYRLRFRFCIVIIERLFVNVKIFFLLYSLRIPKQNSKAFYMRQNTAHDHCTVLEDVSDSKCVVLTLTNEIYVIPPRCWAISIRIPSLPLKFYTVLIVYVHLYINHHSRKSSSIICLTKKLVVSAQGILLGGLIFIDITHTLA